MRILISTMIAVLIAASFVATASTPENKNYKSQSEKIRRAETKTEKVISDTMITAKVKELYLEDEDVSALKIHVTTKDQIVTLTGSVHTDYEKTIAINLAKTVKGVKEVKCKLKVLTDPIEN